MKLRASVVVLALLARVSVAEPTPTAPPAHRAMPTYNGRDDAPTTAGDVARGVLRVVLFPIRVVVDYGIRWPIGKTISFAEHSHGVRAALRYLFLLPPTPTPTIFPIAFYDFGFQSSIGVRVLWTRGFLTPGSRLSLKLGNGGADWWRADGNLLVAAPKRFRGFHAGIDGALRHRPDQQFFGLGPRSPQSAAARYTQTRMTVSGFVGFRELSFFAASTETFTGSSNFNGRLSIEDQVSAGRIAAEPAGYGAFVVTRRYGGKLALDTRGIRPNTEERDRTTSGARIDAVLEHVRDREIGEWLHLDATLGGALRLDTVKEHKLDVRMRIELIEPTATTTAAAIPFVELASIGGSRDLRGFASGRGRDLSAAAFMIDYQWPIAAWLDATLYLGAGNVFGHNLSGLTAGKLRGSAGMGVALAGLSADRELEAWAAFGTDPFDQGADVNSFRLVLGYSHDY
ncbi:MAG TPA: hypothetical protein VIV40_31860 [Kofleriaceae bacterium]